MLAAIFGGRLLDVSLVSRGFTILPNKWSDVHALFLLSGTFVGIVENSTSNQSKRNDTSEFLSHDQREMNLMWSILPGILVTLKDFR